MKKIIIFALILLTVIPISAITAFASDNDNVFEETIVLSKKEYDSFKPDQEKEINGVKYTFRNYDVVSENEVEFSIETTDLKSKKYKAAPTAENPNDKSQIGVLSHTEYEEVKTDNRTKVFTKSLNYSAVKPDYNYPDTLKSTYSDKITGKEIDAILSLKSVEKGNPYWITANALKGTVSMYDSSRYYLDNSNITVPKNEEKPIYKGYENAILRSLNLDSSEYKIIGSSWAGDVYYDSDDILCRDCIYNAQIRVCDAVATYESEINLPDITTYTAVSTYIDENKSTVVLKVTYDKVPEKVNKTAIILSVVIGLLVLSGLIAIILMFLSKRNRKKNKQ